MQEYELIIYQEPKEYETIILSEDITVKKNIQNVIVQNVIVNGIGDINWTSANQTFI